MKAEEKRKAPRVFHSLRTLLIWEDRGQERASTIDLSASGVLLDTQFDGKVGDRVHIRFELPSGYFQEADGVVMRSKPAFGGRRNAVAVAFLEHQHTLYATAIARESIQNPSSSQGRPLTA